MTGPGSDPRSTGELVRAEVEATFACTARIADAFLNSYASAIASGNPWHSSHVVGLRRQVLDCLHAHNDVVVGLGVIVEPGLLADLPRFLEWWQAERGQGAPNRLDVDLNPGSLGFYDYATADWFAVPKQTGHRHVVGPYVDVHGTDRYLLTLSVPVYADGNFLGVVGVDVPVARFESRLIDQLTSLPEPTVVVNSERRVVVSTSSDWIAGSLVPQAVYAAGTPLADLPWRLVEDHA